MSELPFNLENVSRSGELDGELDQELDEAISGFENIQAELNYRQAQSALRDLVENLDLSPQERRGLEPEIGGLESMLDKLDRQVVHIAVFGMVGRGKSSLLNALLGDQVFETGPIHGVTRVCQSANWRITQETIAGVEHPLLRVALPSIGNSCIELIDTPGIDEINGEAREALARQIAKQADLILFLVAGDMTKVEYQALSELREASKPILLVFNKIDQYPDADRLAIYEKIRDQRVRELLSPDEIVMAAASPLVARAVRRADGTLAAQLSVGKPQIADLKLKILEILHREGKSLVALNSMLYADEANERLVERKMEIRDQSANRIIWNGVMTKAVAIALNPVTVVDILSSAVIDIVMILSLSKLYGIPMNQQAAVSLLQKIALSMGGITASELVANLGLSSLKTLLGLSAPATGGVSLAAYASVAVTQAGVAGVSSYGIGQVTKAYLANGASWGPEGPKAVVTRILASLDEASILNRIKDELRAKVDLSRHSLK
ncbi:GTP-binding protein [Leptothermofonsia sichuanensis E412]|uniref:GTP-binding protein n=1 Tax=Leptothermofonsia sichuanensis TaxID=2917832 RepID=UPI001CA6A24B|nr:GTP-binding protein [Leptothermofonsia sichuanensis]QZZ18627.1 GTP-binding protein [Leptothermofonsia sichuanensis E412]